jgi:outer membrane lipoprotein-sorting protein
MRRFAFLLLTACVLPALACAQTVDEIIARNMAAKGGLASLKAVQTFRMTGDVAIGPMQASFVEVHKRPGKMRRDITIQGMTLVQACNGESGWQIVPFTGKKDPEPMAPDDLKQLQQDADMDGPLLEYKQKGYKVELAGKERVAGTDAYHLKITLKGGDMLDLYLDAVSYLETKIVSKTTLGDYRKVNGLMFPFSIETHTGDGQSPTSKISISKVEVNFPVNDSVFAMPPPAPAGSPK